MEIFNLKFFKERGGFTMSELLIATSLFIIVISMASGAFIQSIRTQRSVVTSTSVNSNVTQALELISREIRTGYGFTPSAAPSRLEFFNSSNQQINYKLSGSSIVRCVGSDITCSYVPITANKIVINSLKFIYPTTSPVRVTVIIQVAGPNGSVSNFQTTVAARTIET